MTTAQSEAKHTEIRAQTQQLALRQNYLKHLANTLLSEEPFFDEQESRKYSGDDEPIKLIVKPGEEK